MFLGTVEENNMDIIFILFYFPPLLQEHILLGQRKEKKNKLKGSFLKWQVNS